MSRRGSLALLLALPLPAESQEARWVTWDSPASGYIGTNPHDRDHLLYEDQDGLLMPAIWEAEADWATALAGCEFVADPAKGSARGRACPAELVVDVLDSDGTLVMIVKRLVALGSPGQQVTFD